MSKRPEQEEPRVLEEEERLVWVSWWRWGTRPREALSVQFSRSVCPTLCQLLNRSMPGLPVHHQLLEFTQAHVHWVGDAIQPSHPLSSPSPPALNLSQHQGLFKWVSSSNLWWPKYWSFSFNISPSNDSTSLFSSSPSPSLSPSSTWNINDM